MDNLRLIDKDPQGRYCILFQNKHALSVTEIEEIFSKFGKICHIRCHGNERGYRFIRYKYLEEAEKAVKDLENHPKIRLAGHKNKNNEDNAVKYKSNFSDKDNQYQNKNQKYNKANTNSKMIDNDSNLSNNENSSASIKSMGSNTLRHDNTTQCIPTNKNIIKSSKVLSCLKATVTDNDEDSIPDLVAVNRRSITSNTIHKKIILNAEEVIVGNIPPNYGAPYILHLFDRFEPIAVSYINTVPHTNIRYCHVYFKGSEDSINVETLFDEMKLSNQKLVVLRPCRLMEEANLEDMYLKVKHKIN